MTQYFLHSGDETGTYIDYVATISFKLFPTHYSSATFRSYTVYTKEACGSVVGWGTMLQARRSQDQIPMRSLNFFNLPNLFSCIMDLGSTQHLTEMCARNILGIFLGVKGGWHVELANLPPSMSWLSRKCGNLNTFTFYFYPKLWEYCTIIPS
jgi:hypothetical protein